jgi:hypothetical protein
MKNTKTWNRDEINGLLLTNPRAVERAMVVLHNRQTQDEKVVSATRHHNGVGFSSWAARRGSYYARWVLGGRSLSGRHLEQATRIALHHSRQLVEEANSRQSVQG